MSSTPSQGDPVVPASAESTPAATTSAAGPTPTPSSDPVWPAVAFRDRLRALLTVSPVATQPVQGSTSPSKVAGRFLILRWNYTRLFAIAWAGFSLYLSLRNAPRPGGPNSVDLFFLMAGLLYVVFAALHVTSANYWRSFLVAQEVPNLPVNRVGLLVRCAGGGLLQVIIAATLVGVVLGLGSLMKK